MAVKRLVSMSVCSLYAIRPFEDDAVPTGGESDYRVVDSTHSSCQTRGHRSVEVLENRDTTNEYSDRATITLTDHVEAVP